MSTKREGTVEGELGPADSVNTDGHSTRRRSHRLLNLATILVTAVFSFIALRGINFKAVWASLASCTYWWLIPALAAFALGTVARGLRWRSLFAPGRRPRPGPTLDAMMIGYLYNNIMPARVGEAARVIVLSQRTPKRPVETIGTVIVERLYDVVVVLVIFFAAQPWLPNVRWFHAAAVAAIVLAIAIAAVAGILIVYGDRPIHFVLRPLERIGHLSGKRLEDMASEVAHGLSGLRNLRVAVEAFLWTIAAWLLTALCAYLVGVAFHLGLPFASGLLIAVVVGLSMILPSPPAALGVFEGAAILALKAYGLPKSVSLPYALVLHAVNFVPYVLVGLFLLHYNARHPYRPPARSPVDPAEHGHEAEIAAL